MQLSLQVSYVRMSEHRDEGHFVEKPLSILKQEYSTPELAQWLQDEIVNKQVGRDHPQSKGNPEMKLYKVFEANKDIRGLSLSTRKAPETLQPLSHLALEP